MEKSGNPTAGFSVQEGERGLVLPVAQRNVRFELLDEQLHAVEAALEETQVETRVSRFVLLVDVAALIDQIPKHHCASASRRGSTRVSDDRSPHYRGVSVAIARRDVGSLLLTGWSERKPLR